MKNEIFFLKLCIRKRKILQDAESCSFWSNCTDCPECVDLKIEIQQDHSWRIIHAEGRKVILKELVAANTVRAGQASA